MKSIFIIFISSVVFVSCGGGGGVSPTLSGTAAQGGAIANATVTIKDVNGTIRTSITGADGKYTVNVADESPPFLLKVPARNGYLYSVATATGTANIHSFTDLIVRNWYKVQGSDIETEFSGAGALAKIPTAADINDIEAAIRNILSIYLANVGITASDFNLITSAFKADHTGFDKVLDNTKVVVSTTGVAVTAIDPATSISGIMASFSLTNNLAAADTEMPSAPTDLLAIPADATKFLLVWSTSTDNVGVAGYNIYRDGTKIGVSPFPVYSDTGLSINTQYCYRVEAFDAAGNLSRVMSAEACATTLSSADTTAPSAPILTATPTSSSRIYLSWAPASDNVGVVGYYIYRNMAMVAGVSAANYTETGLSEVTQYCYTIKAIDAALNISVESNQACATTQPAILPNILAGSCTVPNIPGTFCIAYIGEYFSSASKAAARAQSPCGSIFSGANVWSAGYCPSTNAVGHCYNSVVSSKSTDTYYYLPLPTDSTISSLQAACDKEGVWFYLP